MEDCNDCDWIPSLSLKVSACSACVKHVPRLDGTAGWGTHTLSQYVVVWAVHACMGLWAVHAKLVTFWCIASVQTSDANFAHSRATVGLLRTCWLYTLLAAQLLSTKVSQHVCGAREAAWLVTNS